MVAEPKLRFRRDDGAEYPVWKTTKLSDISMRVTRRNIGSVTDIPLTIAALYGFVDQRSYFNKVVASQNMENYYLLKKGEFAYNKSYSKGFDFGAIKRLDGFQCGALSTLYICFALKNLVDSDFMTFYFDSQKWIKEVAMRCAEGARNHGLLNISASDFFDVSLCLPVNVEEQQKIAAFLSDLDAVISASEAEVAALEQQKKGAMQKIFSQEVRFRRDDGTEYPEWIIFPMSDLIYASGERNSDNADLETYSVNNEKGFIPQSEQFDAAGYLENTNKKLYYIVSPGSFAYNPARINVGSIGYLETNHNVLVSSLYEVFRTYDRLNDKFLWYWFHSNAFQKAVRKYSEGGVRQYFFFDKMLEIRFALPCLEEQQKIADFLSSFDEAITLARRELEKWKLLKKSLMQQMFV